MKRQIMLILCLFFAFQSYLTAQSEYENKDFEEWTYDTAGEYYEPNGYWATINPISKLGPFAPVTTFRETEDVYSGTYAVKLVTGTFGTLPVAGTLATGYFDSSVLIPTNALKIGVPFTEKPIKISGYYKYLPENGDSAVIVSRLSKYIDGEQVILAEAGFLIEETVNEYTYFEAEYEYFSSEMPDSMMTIFTSSAGAADFVAAEGSTLYIDEIALEYNTGVKDFLMPDVDVNIFPNPAQNKIQLALRQPFINAEFIISNIEGRVVKRFNLNEKTLHEFDISDLPRGIYAYQIIENKLQLIHGGKLQINRNN
ncbi:MAG: PCMD domain-containing protein [Chitinophagales bacterium]